MNDDSKALQRALTSFQYGLDDLRTYVISERNRESCDTLGYRFSERKSVRWLTPDTLSDVKVFNGYVEAKINSIGTFVIDGLELYLLPGLAEA